VPLDQAHAGSIRVKESRVLVAHACNPSYSGGRDHEDCGQIVCKTLSRKNPITKKDWRSDSRRRP
jgi:hypothetical protein